MYAEIGKAYRFDYPKEFVTLPEYTARIGQTVTVLSVIEPETEETEAILEIQAADGWKGHAFDGELVEAVHP